MRIATFLLFVFTMVVPLATSRAADPDPIPIGVATIDITPDGPIRLAGYGSRKTESEGVEQKLHAKALALGADEGPGPCLFVMVENCGVPAALTEDVAERLKTKARLARERFVVASSHTHTGPCLTPVLPYIFGAEIPADQRERIDRYTRELADRIERVALDALADRRPARLAWGQGTATFAANRRVLKDGKWVGFGVTPGGAVDHALPLLRVTDLDDKLRAVLVGYACHGTTLGGDFNKVCGDWIGYAMEAIERDHPGATALVVIGCGADANPEPRNQLPPAKDHGAAVAREARRLLAGRLTPIPGPIVARFRRIALPFDTLPSRQEWAERSRKPGAEGLHAREQLAKLDRGEPLPTTLDYPVQTWTFGDELAMVFLGGEVVVDYALRLKREGDGRRLWINAYCNDVPCYIASKRILREGGYEADTSMIYYGRPTRLAPEVEDQIIRTVFDLLPPTFAKR